MIEAVTNPKQQTGKRPFAAQGESAAEFKHVSSRKTLKRTKQTAKHTNQNAYQKIGFIPQICLTAKDMSRDPLQLIMKLQEVHRKYGAVKLVTPLGWQPSFNFKYSSFGVPTRIQPLHRLRFGKAFEEKRDVFSLKTFLQFALDFQKRYKFKFEQQGSTFEAQLEHEYWSIVRGGTKEEEAEDPKKYKTIVEYAADLPTNKFGSAFPRHQSRREEKGIFNYAQSLFNLNNLYQSQHSLLQHSVDRKEGIGGITIPWLYIGMRFSTFCWHVEDCAINSINYNHQSGIKTWYVVPGAEKEKFDHFLASKGKKDLLGKITLMIDPLELEAQHIRVYKAYQRPGEYICTFFNAYHCGFSQGFNVGEAANFITVKSIPYIKSTTEQNIINKNPSLFCLQWLLQSNNNNPQLREQYEKMLAQEERDIIQAIQKYSLHTLELIDGQLKYDRLSCCTCKNYVYLSFLRCNKCQLNYCFRHVEACCPRSKYVLIFREPSPRRKQLYNTVLRLLA